MQQALNPVLKTKPGGAGYGPRPSPIGLECPSHLQAPSCRPRAALKKGGSSPIPPPQRQALKAPDPQQGQHPNCPTPRQRRSGQQH